MSSTRKQQLFCWILAFLHVATSQKPDNYCFNHNGRDGTCVPIRNCPKLFGLASRSIISVADRQFLIASKCPQQDGKVCCEDASTPSFSRVTPFSPSLMTLPTSEDCGKANAGPKIVNGNRTGIDEFRWTVALDYNMIGRKGVQCGGSLINTRYIITAAHCVYKVEPSHITARLAEWDLENDPDSEDEIEKIAARFEKIDLIIIHPAYRRQQNDIALLRMENALPANYTNYILPICLPTSGELRRNMFVDTDVSVAGWGATASGSNTMSRYKMKAELTITSPDDCKEEYIRSMSRIQVNSNHICVKPHTSLPQDTCGGDSGGPLQTMVNGDYYLIGVISTGPPCGTTLMSGIYTRITPYIDWILENLVE